MTDDQLRQITAFIADVDDRIPWHVSAYHPTYLLTDASPTPPSALEKAVEIGAAEGLKFIYLGNVNGRSDTICPACRSTVITRSANTVRTQSIEKGTCPGCRVEIPGIWT